ncbi:hypothetical protein ACIBKY_51955 [Nonomuraea sp. NPDC050394]|uniref:hypothetical protein n=1 Tax=Nonomuraea sp. NPDC050394 TaxID=3364363 RepID=UPI0037AEE4ED
MDEPRGAEAPQLLAHTTWRDDDGYHARYVTELPQDALANKCLQELHAPTAQELARAAVANRIRVAIWATGMNAAPSASQIRDPR